MIRAFYLVTILTIESEAKGGSGQIILTGIFLLVAIPVAIYEWNERRHNDRIDAKKKVILDAQKKKHLEECTKRLIAKGIIKAKPKD